MRLGAEKEGEVNGRQGKDKRDNSGSGHTFH
jgi:hypothetical protein